MGGKARQSAIARYSTELVIPKYIEFYERVLNNASARNSAANGNNF
ncbi:MAG TPA: hypothetical protein VEQ34_04060 [Pyrinomonadaceae bacterium]|nr:hypothetical protein [Pyrinomonadaceae bacterium]